MSPSLPTSRCFHAGGVFRKPSTTLPVSTHDSIGESGRLSCQDKHQRSSKVRELSKGMVVQLHLALVMAIDASLLVLDEPTLGLDILYRKRFYDSLLNDHSDRNRTIVVTTHQIKKCPGLRASRRNRDISFSLRTVRAGRMQRT